MAHDPLVCFVDAQGRKVRIGDTVRDRLGREIGWISGSQCAANTPPGKLRIVPNLYGPVDPIEVDAGVLLSADKDVVLTVMPTYLEEFAFFKDSLAIKTTQEALLGDITPEELANQWADYLTKAQQKFLASKK